MKAERSVSLRQRLCELPLGVVGQPLTWPQYVAFLGVPQVDTLIALALEVGLCLETSPVANVPIHAWRALGQMGTCSAIAPLISLLSFPAIAAIHQELPYVFAYLGPAALPALANVLSDARQPLSGRLTACQALVLLGQSSFAATHDCIAVLKTQLAKSLIHPPQLNAVLVEALIGLAAIEAIPVVACAFSNGRIDTSLTSDWLTVQRRLGLISYAQWQN